MEVAWVDQNKVMVEVVVRMSIGNVSSKHDVQSDSMICLGIDPQVLEDDAEFQSMPS